MDKTTINMDYVTQIRTKNFDKMFPIVEASKLSLNDEFMKFSPYNDVGQQLKEELIVAIKCKPKDFRVASVDPSFINKNFINKNNDIIFAEKRYPAIGKEPNWWYKKLKEFMPEYQSRLGSKRERVLFLGYLIKVLTGEVYRYSPERAWEIITLDSSKYGVYLTSFDKKKDAHLCKTGERGIDKFCDLANTFKIIYDEVEEQFILAGGSYNSFPFDYLTWPFEPIAKFSRCSEYNQEKAAVGWMVLSKDPDISSEHGFLKKFFKKLGF